MGFKRPLWAVLYKSIGLHGHKGNDLNSQLIFTDLNYSCGLSTATIEYSSLSVCLSVLVSVCLSVCVSVCLCTR